MNFNFTRIKFFQWSAREYPCRRWWQRCEWSEGKSVCGGGGGGECQVFALTDNVPVVHSTWPHTRFIALVEPSSSSPFRSRSAAAANNSPPARFVFLFGAHSSHPNRGDFLHAVTSHSVFSTQGIFTHTHIYILYYA